nr:ribonuclease H-like domain-containing protein [Tanacetum cinerariifolium]
IKDIGKKEEDSKALITVNTLVDWTYHDGESDGVIASKEFRTIAGCDTEDAIDEGAAKIYNLITEADTEEASTAGDAREFALMGVTSEVQAILHSTTSASKKMSYGDSPSYSSTTTYTAPSNSKTGSHRFGNVIEDVLQSFVADTEPEQQLAYEDFEHIEKLDLEEMDLKWQIAMLSVRVYKFEQKARMKIDFDKKESARFNKKKIMKMEQYLAHTYYAQWEVILNGNSAVQITKAKAEGLDKGYDRFQRLLSLLEIHGADDLYNKLKVYEAKIKGSSGSSSNSQNVAFVSAESTSSTNEINATYSVSTATCHNSQAQGSLSYVDELMFLFFANQSSSPQLGNEDLEQIDQDDLEEMDLKWQVECSNCYRRGHFARDYRTTRTSRNKSRDARNAGYRGRDNGKRPAREEDEKALVVQDGLGTYD